jgi:hypothetical protein
MWQTEGQCSTCVFALPTTQSAKQSPSSCRAPTTRWFASERKAPGRGKIDVAAELQHPIPLPLEDRFPVCRRQLVSVQILRFVDFEFVAVRLPQQRHSEHVDAVPSARTLGVEHVGAQDIVVLMIDTGQLALLLQQVLLGRRAAHRGPQRALPRRFIKSVGRPRLCSCPIPCWACRLRKSRVPRSSRATVRTPLRCTARTRCVRPVPNGVYP